MNQIEKKGKKQNQFPVVKDLKYQKKYRSSSTNKAVMVLLFHQYVFINCQKAFSTLDGRLSNIGGNPLTTARVSEMLS